MFSASKVRKGYAFLGRHFSIVKWVNMIYITEAYLTVSEFRESSSHSSDVDLILTSSPAYYFSVRITSHVVIMCGLATRERQSISA
jgi:hypothetical protein